jgi:serine/threonine protein kinase
MDHEPSNDETIAGPPVGANPHAQESRVDVLGLTGRVLEDRYEIEELIGAGAMGFVYRGRQLRLRRAVAIKVPKPELCTNPEFMARFEREALTMARCVHENICAIYDVSVPKDEGLTYIAMELINGAELDRFLRAEEGNLTVKAVVDILKQIARGIDAAHAAGIIHRDIKPSNMIVTLPQRVAKIMDFGIAKADVENSFETQATQAIGTPAFMAPEQIRGETVGPAADIYAYGMTLYKIFARDLPFKMTSAHSLLFAHLDATPFLLSQRNPLWPKELDGPLAKAIEKAPENRPATATRLMEDIEAALKPVSNEPFGSFYGAGGQNSQVAMALPGRASAATAALDDNKKKYMIYGGAAFGVILFLGLLTAIFSGGDDPETIGVPDPNQVAMIPKPTPVPTPTPYPSPTPTPVPTPEPTAGPTPTPVIIVVTPTPTPQPTRTPPPTRTPRPTPSPTPTPEVTPEPVDVEPTPVLYAWGREMTGGERNLEIRLIEDYFSEKIRRPIYRGNLDDAEQQFGDVPPAEKELFFRGMKTLVERYDNVTVQFVRVSERIDGRRCDIRVRTGVTGAKQGTGGQSQIRLIEQFEATVSFEKRGDNWVLIEWPSKLFFPNI